MLLACLLNIFKYDFFNGAGRQTALNMKYTRQDFSHAKVSGIREE